MYYGLFLVLSSVMILLCNLLNLIDQTSTAIGKRLLKERLLNPICDLKTLNERFDLSSQLIKEYKKFEIALKQVYDLERIFKAYCA